MSRRSRDGITTDLALDPPPPAAKPLDFAFLAETSRCLASSLDLETTLATSAALALPRFGTWCIVDVVEADESIRRLAVIHPDAEKQRLARDFYDAHPPGSDDPIGAARVIRTRESEFVGSGGDALKGITEAEHRILLAKLDARSFLVVPMTARERTLGAITFVSDTPPRYDRSDLLLAEDLGRRCGMAIDNARLYAAAEEGRRVAEAAREAATLTAARAEELLDEANLARHEAADAHSAKTTFLGTISHEFRTPLTAVQGFADLLADDNAGTLNDAQRHQVERIRSASDHLLHLVEEILAFAGQQTGRCDVNLVEIDLTELVRDAAALIEPLAAAKGLAFPLGIPDAPLPFWTDPGKLRQIILNLAANAVKFTDAGELRLDLEVGEGAIELRVGDTGAGISAEDAASVFEPFWQVDQSAMRRGGTGLGLAVTRQLAELLGGAVTLRSEPGRGSVFAVSLPFLPAPVYDGPDDETPREQRVRGRRGPPRRGAAVPGTNG